MKSRGFPLRAAFLNGKWLPVKSAHLSPMDHGFLYGDGIFETLRVYDKEPFKIKDHLERLRDSARVLRIPLPYNDKRLTAIVSRLIRENNLEDGMIRLTLTRGPGPIGLDIALCPKPTFLVLAFPFSPHPASLYQKGISLQVTDIIRNSVKAIPPSAKTANFLNNILAGIEARQKGAREAVLINDKGFVTEGTVTNLFIVKKGKLLTPPEKAGILLGVTRKVVLEIAIKERLPVEERLFRPASIFSADECFVTSSGYEIMPATKINGKKIGAGKPGPVTQTLIRLFRELTGHPPVYSSTRSLKEKGKFNQEIRR